jgi:hypothetical protein
MLRQSVTANSSEPLLLTAPLSVLSVTATPPWPVWEAAVLSACNLVEYFDPRDDAGSASELADFRIIMDGYLTSLEALAASETATQAQAQAEAIVAAFGMPDPVRPAAFERLGASVRKSQTLITSPPVFW